MTYTLGHNAEILIFSGATLFFLGLFQGGLIPFFLNSRMALSAHVTAVQSGVTLIIFGLIWPLVDLSNQIQSITMWSIILGFYLLWLGIVLAALLGASKALPIAGKGYSASTTSETLVTIVIRFSSILTLVAALLIVVGLGIGFWGKG